MHTFFPNARQPTKGTRLSGKSRPSDNTCFACVIPSVTQITFAIRFQFNHPYTLHPYGLLLIADFKRAQNRGAISCVINHSLFLAKYLYLGSL
jgi:hypothetical protein